MMEINFNEGRSTEIPTDHPAHAQNKGGPHPSQYGDHTKISEKHPSQQFGENDFSLVPPEHPASPESAARNAAEERAATSAAPTYFPAIQVNDRWFVDGSLSTNNPILIAYSEAKKLWPYENIKILSIGTGYDSRSYEGKKVKNWGIFSWLKGGIMQVLMESNSEHLIAESLLNNDYLRITSRLINVNHKFDDITDMNLDACKDMGNIWWNNYGRQTVKFLSSH